MGDFEDRSLVSKTIKTLAAKDSDDTLPGAREAAKKILTKHLQRLGLGPVNMLSVRDQEATNEVNRFIYIVRTFGLTEEALKLIENFNFNAEQQQHYPEPRIVSARIGTFTCTGTGTTYIPNPAHRFLRLLGDLLGAHRAPFMESLRGLFEHLLRQFALPPLPVYQARLPGWAHRPRGCGGPCKPCEDLDGFLADDQWQTGNFSHLKRVPDRDHITKCLPSNLFKCVTSSPLDLGRTDSFLIYKISQGGEFREALSAYEVKARALRDCTKDLHGGPVPEDIGRRPLP